MKVPVFCLLFFFLLTIADAAADSVNLIRQRIYESVLIGQYSDELVREWVQAQQTDGSWPDINYEDLGRAAFLNQRHLSRLKEMARAYRQPDSVFFRDKRLKDGILRGVDFWVQNDFHAENWWWNEIGTPWALIDVIYLMGVEIGPERLQRLDPIVSRADMNAWGARKSGDRVKIAGLRAKYCVYRGYLEELAELIQIISGEIEFADGVIGLQVDYSFHHRKDGVNNTLSYGKSYAEAFSEWADFTRGTEYALPADKVNLLVDYYLNGISRMLIDGRYPDPGAKNRSLSRVNELNPLWSAMPEQLLRVTDYRREDLEAVLAARNGDVSGIRPYNAAFWRSDYMSQQGLGWFSSVRMYSSRNKNAEYAYNGEGLLHHYTGDGANYLSLTGEEYINIWPVFDYQKIPGTTRIQQNAMPSIDELAKQGLSDFVGSVSDGKCGVAAMDFISPHDALAAKKAWFFFEDAYLCLGAGIQSESAFPVLTTLSQCLLSGPVEASTDGGQSVLDGDDYLFESVDWVAHASVAYVFLEPTKAVLSKAERTGSWKDISLRPQEPSGEMNQSVFALWIDHGRRPQDESYAYAVVPHAVNPSFVAQQVRSDFQVLSNSSALQAIYHPKSDSLRAVFYDAGEVSLNDGRKLGLNSPGLVMSMWESGRLKLLTVSDPTQKLDQLSVEWIDADGPHQRLVDLPEGVYAGQSVVLEL